jgi:hypothetical protein
MAFAIALALGDVNPLARDADTRNVLKMDVANSASSACPNPPDTA